MENPLTNDLNNILYSIQNLCEELRGKKIFITGGTGFFGKWLLESFIWINEHLNLNAQAHVLSRTPNTFMENYPYIANAESIIFYHGNIRNFSFPDERFDYIFHAATQASKKLNDDNPLLMLDTIAEGTRRILDFAISCGAKRFLLTSSGAVYGKQPENLSHIPEDYIGAPDISRPSSAYDEGKRIAELLCNIYQKQYGLETVIARCFTFIGPYLPLDINYAIGNFIRDGLAGGPIRVNSDGSPYRSYLYASDLAIWLWTILFSGIPGEAYNVGSEDVISIKALAYKVAGCFQNNPEVIIARAQTPSQSIERYVPSIKKAKECLGLSLLTGIDEALEKTIKWYQKTSLSALRTNCNTM